MELSNNFQFGLFVESDAICSNLGYLDANLDHSDRVYMKKYSSKKAKKGKTAYRTPSRFLAAADIRKKKHQKKNK